MFRRIQTEGTLQTHCVITFLCVSGKNYSFYEELKNVLLRNLLYFYCNELEIHICYSLTSTNVTINIRYKPKQTI